MLKGGVIMDGDIFFHLTKRVVKTEYRMASYLPLLMQFTSHLPGTVD